MKILLFMILFEAFIRTNCKLTEIIHTTKGPVQGDILRTVLNSVEYSSFKGIPYAEPPLGYLRFKPPVEIAPWSKILRTTIEGPNCVQKDFVYQNYTGSEDCLYLNVYTPQIQFNSMTTVSKPVMVWIYGGTFKSGYGNSSLYGPDFLIEEDIVLVTFNYRLGPLGFLCLNHENATGNAGLKDQNLVLRWVNENIAKFGGNPKKITIFGHSAGGVAVDLHALSDISKDLFHQSISMSASPLCPWAFSTPYDSERKAFALGALLNVRTSNKEKLLKVLYEAPAVTLMQKTEQMGSVISLFTPTIENPEIASDQIKFLTKCSYDKYIDGDFLDIPHITGFTKDETLLYAKSLDTGLDLLNRKKQYMESIKSLSPVHIPFIDRIMSSFTENSNSLTESAIKGLIQETSDLLFVQGIDTKQKLLRRKSSSPIYYYHLTYETDRCLHKLLYNISFKGVAHGDDLGYLFHMKVVNLSLDHNDPTFITRKRMARLWANFAKYANPTPDGIGDDLLEGVTWPAAGPTDTLLEISKHLTVSTRPAQFRAQLYEMANHITLPYQAGCMSRSLSHVYDSIKSPVISLINTFSRAVRRAT